MSLGVKSPRSSAAYELSNQGKVLLLEREDQPGYHSTGRAAVIFTEAYGNMDVHARGHAGADIVDRVNAVAMC